MSQDITPTNGGRETIQTSTVTLPNIFISQQYLKAKKLFDSPTEWVPDGRPIYDRLPAISERYKLDFGFDDNKAYVYLPVGKSLYGPNSLEVTSSDDKKYLIIKSGTAVWQYGSYDINPVILNLEEIGLSSTRYTFAYQFFLDDAPYDAFYSVSDYSLQGYEMNVVSNTDDIPGWRYNAKYAFCNLSDSEWRNYDGAFPSYSGSAVLTWQFPIAASLTKIELRCPPNTSITGSATLAITGCVSTDENAPYCENPEFTTYASTDVQSDDNGQFFVFEIPDSPYVTGWSVSWTDPKVAIQQVLVSGTISLKKKPSESLTRVSLVAYPQTSLPPTATDSSGNEVPAVYCKLAEVDTSNDYRVLLIRDIRESVNTDYKPIAEWLTRPWDENLIDLHGEVSDYANLWMAPSTCMAQEYLTLEDKFITLEK